MLGLTPTLLTANENNQNQEARWETYGPMENSTHFGPSKFNNGWLLDTIVYGSLEMKNVVVQGNLTVTGLTKIKDSEIQRSLMVYGTLMARDLFVKGTISVQGKTKIREATINGSLDAKGKTYIEEISIGQDLNVFGPLEAEKIIIQGHSSLQGNTECKESTFQGPVTVNGLFLVKDSIFKQSLSAQAELVELDNCQTQDITVADNNSGKPQIVKLKGNSLIQGNITFTNKVQGNVVEIGKNTQLSGRVINGELQKH